MEYIKTLSAITLATVISYGCSSGGDSAPAATPNGIYSGTITGGDMSSNGLGEKAIIYNGRMMVISTNPGGTSQFFDGQLTASGLALTGSGERYDGADFLNTVDYDGAYVNGLSATIGFVQAGSGASTLASGIINLEKSATLLLKGSAASKLLGTWSGSFESSFGSQMDLNFDSAGTITSGGDQAPLDCTFTGSVTPADTVVNVYNASITSSGGSQCTMPAGDYTGFAWTEGDTDGTLVLMVANGSGSRAVILTKN